MSARAYRDRDVYLRLPSLTRRYWIHLVGLGALSLLAAPLALLVPLPIKIAVDSVIGSEPVPAPLGTVGLDGLDSTTLLVLLGLALVGIALLSQLQQLLTTLLRVRVAEQLVLDLRARLFAHVQRLSLLYHDARGTSDAAYRIQYDAPSIQYIAIDGLIPFLTAALTIVAMVAVTASIDPELAAIGLLISPVLFVLVRVNRRRLRSRSHEVKRLETAALRVVNEVLSSLRVVKAFGQEEREHRRFVDESSRGLEARVRLTLVEAGLALVVALTISLGTASVLVVGVMHVRDDRISLGELLLVMTYLAQLYAPLQTVSKMIAGIQTHLASMERVFALLDEKPDVPDDPAGRHLERAGGRVAFQRVRFSYPGTGRDVLRGVDLDVPAGSRVGIAGSTGAGKTTILGLIARFFDPTAGRILLDGVDLREYRLDDVRNQFGIVLQEPVLFSTSITQNIAYARPGASRREIEAAARAANAHGFIERLPDGYETRVGERGMSLSGGERQRVSIARAFLKDAPLLLLDEPTSSVDLVTEELILDAMERLMEGRTSFLVSHRPAALERCSIRLVLRDGSLEVVAGDVATPPARPRRIAVPVTRIAVVGGHD